MFPGCCSRATDSAFGVRSFNSRFTVSNRACDDRCMPKQLSRAFFSRSVHEVAPDLIGVTLLFRGVGGPIIEVEAYHHTDPAAHSYHGPTSRNAVMFGPPGYVYVYRSYGIHWCLNFVCEPKGSAAAVLIRALEPVEGLATMRRRRGVSDERLLCSGPGRLCEALAITRAHNGLALDEPPFQLLARSGRPEIVAGVRIGLTKAADKPWRYGLKGSRFLSKPFRS
jgi:DNA-3-methyladenine glycosylase